MKSFQAQSGVICVDIHPDHPHMLAAGLSDGNVAVYNLQKNPQKPSYISTARNGKHTDIVWQVTNFFREINLQYYEMNSQ